MSQHIPNLIIIMEWISHALCVVKNGLEKTWKPSTYNVAAAPPPPVRQNYTIGSNIKWSFIYRSYLTNNGPLLKFGQNEDRLKHAILTDVGHRFQMHKIYLSIYLSVGWFGIKIKKLQISPIVDYSIALTVACIRGPSFLGLK